jgi:hypothetical protein
MTLNPPVSELAFDGCTTSCATLQRQPNTTYDSLGSFSRAHTRCQTSNSRSARPKSHRATVRHRNGLFRQTPNIGRQVHQLEQRRQASCRAQSRERSRRRAERQRLPPRQHTTHNLQPPRKDILTASTAWLRSTKKWQRALLKTRSKNVSA